MIDSLRWLARYSRLKVGLLLVRAGERLSGVRASQQFRDADPDRVVEAFRRDLEASAARPNPGVGDPPQGVPQAVVGERGQQMLCDGRRPRRPAKEPPPPPLKGSAADRLAQRDAAQRAKGG